MAGFIDHAIRNRFSRAQATCSASADSACVGRNYGFVLWQANFDPVGKENQHQTAAKELLWIREQLLLLIERCHIASVPLADLQASLEKSHARTDLRVQVRPKYIRCGLRKGVRRLEEGGIYFQ